MTEHLKGVRLRLYPNKTQEETLRQMCGNNRFVWNQLNSMIQSRYENNKHLYDSDNSKEAKEKRRHVMLSHYDMNNLLPQLKNEYPFLRLSESSALQMTAEKLSKAYSISSKILSISIRLSSRNVTNTDYDTLVELEHTYQVAVI